MSYSFLYFVLAVCLLCEGSEIFWQITDNHEFSLYSAGVENPSKTHCIKKQQSLTVSKSSVSGLFGDYDCDAPPVLLPSALDAFTSTKTSPSFILWSGDAVSMFSKLSPEQVLSDLTNTTNAIKNMVKKQFPTNPPRVIPLLGNHDTYPSCQWPPEGPFFVYDAVAELWKDWLSAESLETLKYGGYYTELIKPGLRALVVNTAMFFYANYLILPLQKDPAGQFAWIRKTLQKAREAHEQVIVFGHIPPGYDDIDFAPLSWREYNDGIIDAFDGYHNDTIVGTFWGHLHRDSFRLIKGSSGNNDDMNIAFASGSVTPRTDNPTITLYTFEPTPFKLIDKTVYYVDLPLANKRGKLEWKLLYRFRDFYRLPDMTKESVMSLVNEMTVNRTEFERFRRFFRSDMEGEANVAHNCAMNDVCWKSTMCTVLYSKDSEVKDCFMKS